VTFVLYNESRYIGYSVYTMLLLGVLVIALQASGAVDRTAIFVIRSMIVIGGTILVVGFIFVPKIVYSAMGAQQDHGTSLTKRTTALPRLNRTGGTPTTSSRSTDIKTEMANVVSRIIDDDEA
jgi:uncharacterized membrane protein